MVRRYVPDPAALAAALAARVDTLERRLGKLETVEADVSALGRGISDLTGQVRALANSATAPPPTPGPATSTTAPAAADDEGQPDWMRVTDRTQAAAWLTGLDAWIGDVLRPLGGRVTAACWPLHPLVVVELLALAAEHDGAYAGAKTTPVSEWVARWLPGASARIARELDRCTVEGGHVANGRAYDVRGLGLHAIAAWWADTHGRDPGCVEAFALSPIP